MTSSGEEEESCTGDDVSCLMLSAVSSTVSGVGLETDGTDHVEDLGLSL